MSQVFENKIDNSSLTLDEYNQEYKKSISDPETFWSEKANMLDWISSFKKVVNEDFEDSAKIKWFEKGTLNVSYNCLDRHLKEKGDKVAIIWESDDPSISQEITYNQLHKKVCKLANGLKKLGIKKGDKVTIYLPMIPSRLIVNFI